MDKGAVSYRAGRLFTPNRELSPGVLTVGRDGNVLELSSATPAGVPVVELGERIISPGFVDLHVHGGAGGQVNGEDEEEVAEGLVRLATFHATHGTTTLLATTVSDSHERLSRSLSVIGRMSAEKTGGARIAGAHLEGPFISPGRAGAQNRAELRRPAPSELEQLAEAAAGSLRLVTIAPELPGALAAIAWGERAGVGFALGHSEADYETASAAFDAGARHVAHLFNAMAPLHHRRPGLLGAALSRPEVSFELIADLEHIHPVVLSLAQRLGPERAVAVSDATLLAGAPQDQEALLGALAVRVSGGRVELVSDPEVLAGSLLTMDQAVRNLVTKVGLALPDALAMATSNPGRLLEGTASPAGVLQEGAPADFVVLGSDLALLATAIGGEAVHDPDNLLSGAASPAPGPGSSDRGE